MYSTLSVISEWRKYFLTIDMHDMNRKVSSNAARRVQVQ